MLALSLVTRFLLPGGILMSFGAEDHDDGGSIFIVAALAASAAASVLGPRSRFGYLGASTVLRAK